MLVESTKPVPCATDKAWRKKIITDAGWKTYSDKKLQMKGCSCNAKNWDHVGALLKELTDTAHAIEDLRVQCVLDHWFDPGEFARVEGSPNILLLSTSDSCDTDDENDAQ